MNALIGEALLARIVEVLAVRQQLVVFDTCEHLVEAVAALVESIGVAADRVDLLLTSREPLRSDGEHVLTLAPLDESGAVALLIDRIQSTAPGWVAQAEDMALVAEIAQRVDRLPLALELAAARVPVMGLRGLRDALEQPYEALYQGRRTAVERHRSLTDVVDWSYRLLTPRQRDLFTRLAVFAGQVEWDAIQEVCRGGDEDSPELSDLADLVDRSLVTVHPGDPTTYGMLDTLRAFGSLQLAEPAMAALRSQHCDWALALADDTYAGEVTPHQGSARRRFDAHLAEIRRAHAFLSTSGPGEDLLRLTIVVAHQAYHRLRVDLLRLVDETLSLSRWDAASAAAATARDRGQRRMAAGRSGHSPSSAASRHLRSRGPWTILRSVAGRMRRLAAVSLMRGDGDRVHDEAVLGHDLALEAGDLYVQLLALVDLGLTAAYTGDDETAAYYEERIGALAAAVDAPTFRAWDSYLRGERQAERGDPAAAVVHSARALELADAVDDRFLAGAARHTILTTAARTDDLAAALTSFGPLIEHWHASGSWNQLWLALRALIDTLARHGRHRDVAVLLGAYASSSRATPVYGADSSRLEAAAAAARDALGDEFDDLSAEGRAMTDDGAVVMARRLTRCGLK